MKKKNKAIDKKQWIVTAKTAFLIYAAIVIAFVVGACHVLAAGDPIATVNNLSNFNRIFKRKKGCAPSEFRENYRKTRVIV